MISNKNLSIFIKYFQYLSEKYLIKYVYDVL